MSEFSYQSPLATFTIKGDQGGKHYRWKVRIPIKEEFRIRAIFQENEYCLPTQSGFFSECPVVMDIGANVGLFTLYAKTLFPEARVYCFEPAPEIIALLRENTRTLTNIEIGAYALSNRTGGALLNRHTTNSGSNSLRFAGRDYAGRVEVEVRDANSELSRIGAPHIDILKIDTEGCETAILQSLKLQLQLTKVVLFEYHTENDRREIERLLSSFYLYAARIHRPGRGSLCYMHSSYIADRGK